MRASNDLPLERRAQHPGHCSSLIDSRHKCLLRQQLSSQLRMHQTSAGSAQQLALTSKMHATYLNGASLQGRLLRHKVQAPLALLLLLVKSMASAGLQGGYAGGQHCLAAGRPPQTFSVRRASGLCHVLYQGLLLRICAQIFRNPCPTTPQKHTFS